MVYIACSRLSECGDCAKRCDQEKQREGGVGDHFPLALLIFFSCLLTSCRTPLSECLERANSYNLHYILLLVLDATGFPCCDLSLN